MDIFKLIFEHDLRLESLRERHTDRTEQDVTLSLEAFLKPDPTYSRFYLSGSRLHENRFGLNTLHRYQDIVDKLEHALSSFHVFSKEGEEPSLSVAIERISVGPALLLTTSSNPGGDLDALALDPDSNSGHRKEPLRDALERGELVLYKEPAHHGFDLHLFSKENRYKAFFYPLTDLLAPDFRFFSINGKRIQSERKFYFETWSLERPPHGIEEVFDRTVL